VTNDPCLDAWRAEFAGMPAELSTVERRARFLALHHLIGLATGGATCRTAEDACYAVVRLREIAMGVPDAFSRTEMLGALAIREEAGLPGPQFFRFDTVVDR
jgi:hypothetical protein